MKSVCKNCCHSQRDGQHLFCDRRLKYVASDYKCNQFAEGRDGDIDNKIFVAFAITALVVGVVFLILSNL